MKKILLIFTAALLLCTLCACGAGHFVDATAEPSIGESTGVSLEVPTAASTEPTACNHIWFVPTCVAPKTCKDCGITEGDPLGHAWKDATCTAPKTCTTCGATEGSATGHDWTEATCTEPKTCHCGATEGKANGHRWLSATYDDPKTCIICGKIEGSPLDKPENYHGHVYTGGPYSKKYHYEADCAGQNSHEITWAEVTERGLEPCGICVLQ